MLHRKRTGDLIGAGERVPHPYSVGDMLIISKWEKVPVYKGRRKAPIRYDIEVHAYIRVDGLEFKGYDRFAPYELGLEWREP